MSKQDVIPLPSKVPSKRRHLEQALDVHIATWLADDSLTPSERKRLEAEKARRKLADRKVAVAVIVGRAGATPEQLFSLVHHLRGATDVHHPRLPRNVHTTCKVQVPSMHMHDVPGQDNLKAAIDASERVIALVNSERVQPYSSGDIWGDIGRARHRNISVTVLSASGSLLQEDS